MAIGGALFEEMTFENGRLLNPRLSRYRVPRFSGCADDRDCAARSEDLLSLGRGRNPDRRVGPGGGKLRFQRHRGARAANADEALTEGDPCSATDPLVGLPVEAGRELWPPQTHYSPVTLYRRRLPHVYETHEPVFLTWRLTVSLPGSRHFPGGTFTSGQAFAAFRPPFDEGRSGQPFLSQPALAELVVEAIHYNARVLGHYILHAFAVMPNHVHVLLTPASSTTQMTKSLKGITANGRMRFWLEREVHFGKKRATTERFVSQKEFEWIRFYVENNPVRAGLVGVPSQYRWSSANWATEGSPADEASAPRVTNNL